MSKDTDSMTSFLDYSGFSQDQFLLGKVFTFPGSSSESTGVAINYAGKTAISISSKFESTLISGYTQLIASIFMAWWIIIALSIPLILPKRICKNKAIMLVTLWDVTEPFQAAVIMAKFSWGVLVPSRAPSRSTIARKHSIRGMAAGSGTNGHAIYQTYTSGWGEFGIGLFVMMLAAATVVGGIFGGLFLPGKLILGHVAPANPEMLYAISPSDMATLQSTSAESASISQMDQIRAVSTIIQGPKRALSVVDNMGSEELESRIGDRVMIEQVPITSGRESGKKGNEEGYGILYNYRVYGYEMGLQKFPDFVINVNGTCVFQYNWYQGHKQGKEVYILFNGTGSLSSSPVPVDNLNGENYTPGINLQLDTSGYMPDPITGTIDEKKLTDKFPQIPFALIPRANYTSSFSTSRDPWYLTGNPDALAELGEKDYPIFYAVRGRPPLLCNEESRYYFGGKYLGPSLVSLEIPTADAEKDSTDSDSDSTESSSSTPTTSPIFEMKKREGLEAMPDALWKALTQEMVYGPIHSVASIFRALETLKVPMLTDMLLFDAGKASALRDFKRIIYATYIWQRNVLQDVALNYLTINDGASSSSSSNAKITRRQSGDSSDTTTNNNILYKTTTNGLLDQTTKTPLPYAGQFVLPSEKVTAVRMEVLIAIPCVVVGSWLLVLVVMIVRTCLNKTKECMGCGLCTCGKVVGARVEERDGHYMEVIDIRPGTDKDMDVSARAK